MFRKLKAISIAAGLLAFAIHGLVLTMAASVSAQQRAITVLVADLAGDPDAAAGQTQGLLDALGAVADVEASRAGPLESWDPEAVGEGLRRARTLLRSKDASLLTKPKHSNCSTTSKNSLPNCRSRHMLLRRLSGLQGGGFRNVA